MHKSFRLFLTITISFLIADQVVKHFSRLVTEGVEGRTISPLIPGIFELKLVYNHGVAFGMFQGGGIWLTPIAIIISALATYYSFKTPNEPKINHVTMALLASGAIGNLIDRLIFGKVTDMFWFRLIDFPVFNIADICISIAGALFILTAIKESIQAKKTPPATASNEDPATSDNHSQ